MSTVEQLELRKHQLAAGEEKLVAAGFSKVSLRSVGNGEKFWVPTADGGAEGMMKAVFTEDSQFRVFLCDKPILIDGRPAGATDLAICVRSNGLVSVKPQDETQVWVK